MDVKTQVINKIEQGGRQVDIYREFNLPGSTVRTISQNADKIKQSVKTTTTLSSTKSSRSRSKTMETMERLLIYWIEDQNRGILPISQAVIMAKAKSLFDDLFTQNIDESGESIEIFSASHGWFQKFKVSANIHSIETSGEADSADVDSTKLFPSQLKTITEEKRLFSRDNFQCRRDFGSGCPSKHLFQEKKNGRLGLKQQKIA